MKKETLITIVFLINSLFAAAQQQELAGKVLDEMGKGLSGAKVLLSQQAKPIRSLLTDTTGKFLFKDLPNGNYLLSIQSLGFEIYQSQVSSPAILADITLKPAVNKLKEVSLTYKQPPVEFQAGKTILHVDGTISAAGASAFEILQRSPGVNVDDNGALRMSGKAGAMVMIDGKLQSVSGEDLASLLKSIPANLIDKIELNTNPSAKYDAAGNAGIIDIRTKREKREGFNGSLTASAIQARYQKATTGMNISLRNSKWSVTSNYNYSNRKDYNNLAMDRQFLNEGVLKGKGNQTNFFQVPVQIHNAQLGVDYNLSKNTTLGLSGSFYSNDNVRLLDNKTTNYNANDALTGYTLTQASSNYHRKNPAASFSLKQKMKNEGALSFDLDYATFSTANSQNNYTTYFKADQTAAKDPFSLYGDLSGRLSIRAFRADYQQPLTSWFNRLEAGLKSSWVTSDNDVAFFDRSQNGNIPLNSISNHFTYKENINAGYISLNKITEKFTANVGLRLEHTETQGRQYVNNVNTERSYLQLFPNLSMTYKVNKINTIGLSLSRRIDRPNYRQLNPFRYYINENTYTEGNTNLRPQLTHAIELSHTIAAKYNIKYTYSRTTDNMLQILSPDPNLPNVVQQTDRNLAVLNFYSLNLSAPLQINKWLKNYSNVLLSYGQFKGNLANTALDAGLVSLQITSTGTFTLSSTFSAELNANYLSRQRSGFLTSRANGTIGAGLQKQLLNKMASLKFNVSDIFLTGIVRATTSTNGYLEHYVQNYDSRQATLSFSYRFGQAPSTKKKITGAEEERRRAG